MTVSIVQSGYASGPGPTLAVNFSQPITPGNMMILAVRIEADPLDPNPMAITPAVDVSRVAFVGSWAQGNAGVIPPSVATSFLFRIVGVNDSEPQVNYIVSNADPLAPALLEIEAVWYEASSSAGPILANSGGGQLGFGPSPQGPAVFCDPIGRGAPFRTDAEFVGAAAYLLTSHPAISGSSTFTNAAVVAPSGFDPSQGVSGAVLAALNGATGDMVWDQASGGDGGAQLGAFIPYSSAFTTIQNVAAPAPWASPGAGNLIILTTWVADPAPPLPNLAGWNRWDSPSPGGTITVFWKPADGSESPASVAAATIGATDSNFYEVTGFTGVPTLFDRTHLDFENASAAGPSGPSELATAPGGDIVGLITAGFASWNQAEVCVSLPDGFQPTRANMGGAFGADAIRAGAGFGPYCDFGSSDPGSSQTGGADFAAFIDSPPEPPTPPAAAGCCPKSIRAIAMRLTRLNASGVPVDPLTLYSRIQTAGFMEVSLSPANESGSETITTAANGSSIAIIDRSCDMMKGLDVTMKLCGVPYPVLEMLLATEYLGDDPTTPAGGVLAHGRDSACRDLVMVELWSKNANAACDASGSAGKWIHWLLPRTLMWNLSGSLNFSNGPLEFEVSGFAERNPAWYPSLPSAEFPSYEPGGGSAAGWPTGPDGPVLPLGLVADPWTLADQQVIRRAGPMAWRCVDELPSPLSDCSWLDGQDCTPEPLLLDFCGPAGAIGDPWEVVDLPYVQGFGG